MTDMRFLGNLAYVLGRRRQRPNHTRLIGVLVAIMLTAGLARPTAADVGAQGEWIPTAPPASPNDFSAFGTLVTLSNGTSLLVGQLVQQYVPAVGSWTPAGSLLGNGGVVTVLANGKLLISGLSPAEVYDPGTKISTLTGAMNIPRINHQATLLPSGDVLVSGGIDVNGQLVGTAEIYHSAGGTWTVTGTMNAPRRMHTAILLPTGKVLAAGGSTLTVSLVSAELYDPATGSWALTNSNDVGGAVSVLLPNGKALVVGAVTANFEVATASQLFDPPTGTWSPTVVALDLGPFQPAALTTLVDGRVLVVGSALAGPCFVLGASLYDATADAWFPASAPSPNSGTSASLITLPDGRALLAALQGCGGNQPGALLFRPDNTSARLAVSPTSVDFGSVTSGVQVQQTITVQNTGQAHLSGSATVSNSHGFSVVSGAAYSLDAGAGAPVVVGFGSAALGAFTDTVTFMSNGGWVSVRLTAIVGVTLSGRISRPDGSGVPNVSVGMQGAVTRTTTTDADGVYAFIAPPGSYAVVPSSATLTFSPPSRNVVVGNTSIGGLDFVATPSVSRLANISTRGLVEVADDVMIGGFIVTGSTPMTVLVRAIGPSLANFGVPGTLPNPFLRLFSGATPIAENDDWHAILPLCQGCAGPADIIATGLAPGDPVESAILITLAPGAYTAIVSGVAGTTGVGLIEVFDVSGSSTSHLANISTRGLVDVGDNVMIGGFIIAGGSPKTVVVRGVGPSLANFGVPGVLANPVLRIFSGATPIAENDDWQSSLPLCQISGYTCGSPSQITATGLAPTDPHESAILITLPPGPYTAILSGLASTTGVGLVEVFEVQ